MTIDERADKIMRLLDGAGMCDPEGQIHQLIEQAIQETVEEEMSLCIAACEKYGFDGAVRAIRRERGFGGPQD